MNAKVRSHCIMSTNMDIVWNVIFFVLVKKESLMKWTEHK